MQYVLVDTDVILDFYLGRKPFAESAINLFDLCEKKRIIGFTTPVIICNVYYLLSKLEKHEIIIHKIAMLLKVIDVINVDKKSIELALQSDFKDFEDAIQNFSAVQQSNIEFIITRNIKDFKNSKLRVQTPKMFLNKYYPS